MSHLSFRSRRMPALAAALLCASAASAFAQAGDTRVLKGRAVTQQNVLDALTPRPGAGASRSLKVTSDGSPSTPSAVVAQQAQKKPSASLLITFETNSAVLLPRSKEQLDVVAAALKNDRLKDFSFDVEGHADPRGTSEGNLTLSQQRADSVRAYLVQVHGLPPSRLRAVGKGDAELLNTRDVAAAENRRVTIVTITQ
jgi:OOP family OmpA-OmpF porin